MTLYYCFDECDFEYEADYTEENVINFLYHYYVYSSESPNEFTRELLVQMYADGFIQLDYLEDDDDFRDYITELNEDDAYTAFLDACDYYNDPLGYHGLSVRDFIEG